jgi:hypothetical protein
MFSLFHYSRVFPYIHPYLFPIDMAQPADPTADASPDPTAASWAPPGSGDAAASARSVQARHLKGLYRRHLRNQRNDTLSYSGVLRRTAN